MSGYCMKLSQERQCALSEGVRDAEGAFLAAGIVRSAASRLISRRAKLAGADEGGRKYFECSACFRRSVLIVGDGAEQPRRKLLARLW